jgi:DNA primase
MKLSELSFNTVRGSVDIVDVISQYLNLKRSGNNFKALCPFHNEKTPSFVVSPQKQIYHCFGCGAGGDVIKFISEIEGLSYYEAALKIAKENNIHIDFKTESKINTLYEITDFVTKLYHKNIKDNFNKNEVKEFIKKRNITDEILEKFSLGYAPDSYNFILSRLRKEQVDLELCEKIGIIKKKTDYYDAFRNRIIFPIKNVSGDVIAFGGRILDDSLPKYLNSPESEIYLKRKNLYGIFENREYIRKEGEVIVVEGYMDLIALWSSGIKNCVATLGTAFTNQQLNLLKRFVKNIIFLYDGDKAGIKAAVKGAVISVNEDFNPKLIYLPEGEDPDDFINKRGVENFLKLKKDAHDFISFIKNVIFQKIDLKNFENKIKLIERLKNIYGDIDNPVYREHFIKGIADILEVEYREIKKYFTKYQSNSRLKQAISEHNSEKRKKNIEETFVSFLLNNHEFVNEVDTVFFENENLKQLIEYMKQGNDFNTVINSERFDSDFVNYIRGLALGSFSEQSDIDSQAVFKDYYKRLKERYFKSKLKTITNKIKELESGSDYSDSELVSLIKSRESILKEVKKILSEGG